MNKFLAILLTICTISFFSCDDNDNDKKKETSTCNPATCEMVEHATEMGCDDADQCIVKTCADTFKVAEDTKSCVADEPACTCDDGTSCPDGDKDKCTVNTEECKCDGGSTCPESGKDACAKTADKCDPKCPEGKECKCVEDACNCADVALICDPVCKEDEDCIKGEDGKSECRAKDNNPEACKCDDGTDCPEGSKANC